MREYLYKAKDAETNKWVFGSLIISGGHYFILPREEDVHPLDYPYFNYEFGIIDGKIIPIIPETICEYTGINNDDGVQIFENDIMWCSGNVVEFCGGEFCINGDTSLALWTHVNVIGNVFDDYKLKGENK